MSRHIPCLKFLQEAPWRYADTQKEQQWLNELPTNLFSKMHKLLKRAIKDMIGQQTCNKNCINQYKAFSIVGTNGG